DIASGTKPATHRGGERQSLLGPAVPRDNNSRLHARAESKVRHWQWRPRHIDAPACREFDDGLPFRLPFGRGLPRPPRQLRRIPGTLFGASCNLLRVRLLARVRGPARLALGFE